VSGSIEKGGAVARRYRRRFLRLRDRLQVESGPEAVQLIRAGQVMVNGLTVTNPDTLVAVDAVVTLAQGRTLRGTTKLQTALRGFPATPAGRVCVDVGAGAGGFTSALLAAGARRVYAADVGFGQLTSALRQDSRVVTLERVNLARLGPVLVPEPVELISVDLSYLAVAVALPQLSGLEVAPGAQLIALVKPTFELGAAGMVVDDEAIRKAVATAVAAARDCGWSVQDRTVSVTGAGGAPEVFIYGTNGEGG
jgi:23S rRNA (cytidine1920-2'-O)/16S rRNA (cytidine1409-2'-O)-methyltransferase